MRVTSVRHTPGVSAPYSKEVSENGRLLKGVYVFTTSGLAGVKFTVQRVNWTEYPATPVVLTSHATWECAVEVANADS